MKKNNAIIFLGLTILGAYAYYKYKNGSITEIIIPAPSAPPSPPPTTAPPPAPPATPPPTTKSTTPPVTNNTTSYSNNVLKVGNLEYSVAPENVNRLRSQAIAQQAQAVYTKIVVNPYAKITRM